MKNFIAICTLPDQFTKRFYSRIPEQMKKINKLMQEGAITSFSLTADRSTLWIILHCNDSVEAYEALFSLPLIKYMKFEVQPLHFHITSALSLTQLSLN